MKVLNKNKVRKSGTIGHVNDERKVLERARSLNSPFLVGLKVRRPSWARLTDSSSASRPTRISTSSWI